MTNVIPNDVTSLFSQPLLGISLGTEITELAADDWDEAPGESGSTSKRVADGYSLRATFSGGRVSQICLSTSPDDEVALRALAGAFVSRLTPTLGAPTQNEESRFERETSWALPGPFAGQLTLLERAHHGSEGSTIDLEVTARLAPGVKLPKRTRSWVDVSALAELVATRAFPATKCLAVLTAFFSEDSLYDVEDPVREQLKALYGAVEAEGRAKEVLEQLVLRADWSDPKERRGKTRYGLALACHWSEAGSLQPVPNEGIFSRVNLLDVATIVSKVSDDVGARGPLAWAIINAVEFADAAARAQVIRQLGFDRRFDLRFESTRALDAALFSLVTAGLSRDQRVEWVRTSVYGERLSALALADWLADDAGVKAPTVTLAKALPHSPYISPETASCWALLVATGKAIDAALGAQLLELALEKLARRPESAAAMMSGVADAQRLSAAKAAEYRHGFRMGLVVVRHTGKKGKGGRLAVKRHKTDAAATKDFAKA